MKYDVVQKTDGNMSIISTWDDNLDGAKKAFFDRCSLLVSDKTSFSYGYVAILDDNLDAVKKEFIQHEIEPEPNE